MNSNGAVLFYWFMFTLGNVDWIFLNVFKLVLLNQMEPCFFERFLYSNDVIDQTTQWNWASTNSWHLNQILHIMNQKWSSRCATCSHLIQGIRSNFENRLWRFSENFPFLASFWVRFDLFFPCLCFVHMQASGQCYLNFVNAFTKFSLGPVIGTHFPQSPEATAVGRCRPWPPGPRGRPARAEKFREFRELHSRN